MERVDLRQIRTDGGTQPRAGIDQETVADYAHELTEGAKFPPVTLFYDGSNYWLADGFHRVAAFKFAGKQRIDADVKQGTLRDAQLFAVGANATHGLRRSREDKRRAVTMLLEDEEWVQWSDREIARRCKVSNTFVGNMREELGLTVNVDSENGRKYVTKHGTEAVMHLSVDLMDAVKRHIMNELKTREPARLASHARALAGRGYVDLWRQLGGEGDTANLRMCLFSLAREWESQIPTHKTQLVERNVPALVMFLDAVRCLPESDLRAIDGHVNAIRATYPADGYPNLNEYANAYEELLCALRPS